LRQRDVAGVAYELPELPVRHWSCIDPERTYVYAMDRRLLGIVLVRPHAERAAGDVDHAEMRRRFSRRFSRVTLGDKAHRTLQCRASSRVSPVATYQRFS